MAAIPTPTQAKTVDDLSLAQFNLVRQSFGINDDPLQVDKTYIVFDAVSGNNNLHLDTGVSSTYTILKGDGTLINSYTDTGGVKVLNYVNAGRYLIVISGIFYGINTDGAIQSDKDKYISIISGSNYPISLIANSFENCANLEAFTFSLITSIGANAFDGCVELKSANIPIVASIGANAFDGCVELSDIILKNAVTIGASAFNAVVLASLIIKSASEVQALVILNDIITANGLFATGFKFIFNSDAGAYIFGEFRVVRDGNPNAHFENSGDDLELRQVSIRAAFVGGIGLIIKTRKEVGETFEDAVSSIVTGLGNTALAFNPNGTLVALITYSSDVGATNKPLFIDDAGLIGVDDSAYRTVTIDIGDWDMDASSSLSIPFPSGVIFANATSPSVYIINDAGTTKVNLEGDANQQGVPDGNVLINNTGFFLSRRAGGGFDSTTYDSTSFNRGHLTFRYRL